MHIGIYIHVPFCKAKCAYCDFASIPGSEDLYAAYARAVVAELHQGPKLEESETPGWFQAETVYFGGGTPSVLPLSSLREMLDAVKEVYAPRAGSEITIEANPGTVDLTTLGGLRALGFNRLSVGVQSFDDTELRLLGRVHDRNQALSALASAQAAGFQHLNLDLMYGLPGQSLATWKASLALAVECRPTHMSLYALSIEEGTPLARELKRGDLPYPNEDTMVDMYLLADAMLSEAGYIQYEISNWAQPGERSRHNVNTWLNGPYLGLGPAAHSHIGRRRWWNTSDPPAYIAHVLAGQSPVAGTEALDAATDMGETMMLGLRLVRDGVSVEAFRQRYGRTPAAIYGAVLDELVDLGLLHVSRERIRLTARGRLLGNQVFARFLPG